MSTRTWDFATVILIDTNVGVWSVYQPDRLGAAARDLLRTDGSPFFSAVLAIETTIKRMNGRLPDEVVDLPAILTTNGLRELAVTAAHALGMSSSLSSPVTTPSTACWLPRPTSREPGC